MQKNWLEIFFCIGRVSGQVWNIIKHRLHVWLRGKQADLSFNPLIDQANMRRKSKAPAAGTEHTMVMDNVSDDFSDESLDPYLGHSLGGRDKGRASNDGSRRFHNHGEGPY